MKFTPISYPEFEDLYFRPQKYSQPHDLKRELKSFLDLNTYVVQVTLEPGEYKNHQCAQSALCSAAQRHKYPIQVTTLHGELYLINTTINPHKQIYPHTHSSINHNTPTKEAH